MLQELMLLLTDVRVLAAFGIGLLGVVFLVSSPARDRAHVRWLAGSALAYGLLQLGLVALQLAGVPPSTATVLFAAIASVPILIALTFGIEVYARQDVPAPSWRLVLALTAAMFIVVVTLYVVTDGWPYSGTLVVTLWSLLQALRTTSLALAKRSLGMALLSLALLAVALTWVLGWTWEWPLHQVRQWLTYPVFAVYATAAGLLLLRDTRELHEELAERKQIQEELSRVNASLEAQVLDRTAELQSLVARLTDYAGMVSHDLRGPVRNAMGLAETALEDLQAGRSGDLEKYLHMIRKECLKGSAMVTDLLSLARVRKGHLKLKHASLTDVVRDSLSSLDLQYPGASARVSIGELPHIEMDVALMGHVYMNVIGNALKYGAATADLQVWVEAHAWPDRSGWRCLVRDNGPGFDGSRAFEIYDPFVCLSPTDNTGTGLGLPLVKRIIECHHGTVGAESEADQGAVFWWDLPTRQPVGT